MIVNFKESSLDVFVRDFKSWNQQKKTINQFRCFRADVQDPKQVQEALSTASLKTCLIWAQKEGYCLSIKTATDTISHIKLVESPTPKLIVPSKKEEYTDVDKWLIAFNSHQNKISDSKILLEPQLIQQAEPQSHLPHQTIESQLQSLMQSNYFHSDVTTEDMVNTRLELADVQSCIIWQCLKAEPLKFYVTIKSSIETIELQPLSIQLIDSPKSRDSTSPLLSVAFIEFQGRYYLDIQHWASCYRLNPISSLLMEVDLNFLSVIQSGQT
jgi:hypothetical protein